MHGQKQFHEKKEEERERNVHENESLTFKSIEL